MTCTIFIVVTTAIVFAAVGCTLIWTVLENAFQHHDWFVEDDDEIDPILFPRDIYPRRHQNCQSERTMEDERMRVMDHKLVL